MREDSGPERSMGMSRIMGVEAKLISMGRKSGKEENGNILKEKKSVGMNVVEGNCFSLEELLEK